ncbi:hypothetical protein GGR56DRAFT_670372 [Xylariaceae sp. FL0804]|nr:hypothetical protein GGR56DRAFT_670372 [Xylariaceae sp. FL0804]
MSAPLFLSPALPSEFIAYVLSCLAHPTTVVVCCSRAEFLAALAEDVRRWTSTSASAAAAAAAADGGQQQQQARHPLLASPLYQLAAARHLRMVYAPTVTHLRAQLSVFSPDDSAVPAPPPGALGSGIGNSIGRRRGQPPHLVLYGLLELHRHTSEWSAQGLGDTLSAAVELAHRLSWQALLVEPSSSPSPSPGEQQEDDGTTTTTCLLRLEDVLREAVPVLSGGARRPPAAAGGPDPEQQQQGPGPWSGRTVEVGRVLERWFRFQRGSWDTETGDGREAAVGKDGRP